MEPALFAGQPGPAADHLAHLQHVMAAMGRRGGKIGGKRRMQTMTAEERRAVALKAAKTRWGKHPKEKN
jgi:hypothetical protein